jgi:DNA processing protein
VGQSGQIYQIFAESEHFPKRLLEIPGVPKSLYVIGALPQDDLPSVAIIGARDCTEYGKHVARHLGQRMAQAGVQVISGMAKGIDGISQAAALEAGGSSYGVLGCGVDICYPRENERLFEQIPKCGGIISEYPPGTMPAAGLFPLRNRIISALCDILLVMEAREKSGTLITVDMALEQGKEIRVLPGRVDDVLSKGCNRLISQGADILPCMEEFEKELDVLCEKYGKSGIRASPQKDVNVRMQDEKMDGGNHLSFIEKAVAATLDYQPLSLNGIYEKLDMESKKRYSIQQVGIALMELCMKNMARQAGGNYYTRC